MAIIDNKAALEAEREAREYAQRNDSAAFQDWQQPPPAYEESTVASSSSNSARPAGAAREANDEPAAPSTSQGRPPNNSRTSSSTTSRSQSADEDTPLLLTRRQRQIIKKKLRAKRKIRKGLNFIAALLLLGCISLMGLQLGGWLDSDAEDLLPIPPASDGKAMQDAVWSKPIPTDPGLWPNPNTPLQTSRTSFSLSAFDNFFLHASGSGSTYSGQVVVATLDDYIQEEWGSKPPDNLTDLLLVRVEARFTDVSMRDTVRVSEMQQSNRKTGVGFYGTPKSQRPDGFLFYLVEVLLPSQHLRSPPGLLSDGSSYIPEVEIRTDNMRMSIEALNLITDPAEQDNSMITFGRLLTQQLNGGLDLVNGLTANESVAISLQNGHVRDITFAHQFTILAPQIYINVVNGPIWLNKLLATDLINLKTMHGAINITEIAVAKSIKVSLSLGLTGGLYRAKELEILSAASDVNVEVDLRDNIFEGELALPSSDDGKAGEQKCQERKVDIHTAAGSVNVRYSHHDADVELISNITSKTGSVKVRHADGFEGSFFARTHTGTITTHSPESYRWPFRGVGETEESGVEGDSWKAKKQFVILQDEGGPLSKRVQGRTWWSTHSWFEKNFCRSQSTTSCKVGNLDLYF